jgi:NADH-quinone oxidoreductase subunit C
VTVPPQAWAAALACARDELGCDFFDWLTGVDELDAGVAVLAHVYSLERRHHLMLRTLLAGEQGLATATGIYRGAAWHERETHEMFGVLFEGHPGLEPLLLPDGFQQAPLRKNFVLAARRDRDWPGAKEPGETAGARGRRRPPAPAIHDGWPAS